MGNKRKRSASYGHVRMKSKKSNTGTENIVRTSSATLTDNQRASMSAIDLNMANLQEQVSGIPSNWFNSIYTVGPAMIDLTLNTSSSELNETPITVTSSGSQHIDGDEMTDDGSSTITACSSFNYSDDELIISDNIDTAKYRKSFQKIDGKLSASNSEVTPVDEQNNGYDQTTNDEESIADTINNSSLFQDIGEELNVSDPKSLTAAVTPVGEQNNGYDQTTNDEESIADTAKHSNRNDEINSTTSESSTAFTSVSQQGSDNNHYYRTQKYEETNYNHFKFTACVYTYNNGTVRNNCDGTGKSFSDNGIQIADNIHTPKHTNTSQCRDGENKNTEPSTRTSRGSTLITSVREQENGCFVYLTEYDEAMNEIRSEVYNIEKPIMPSLGQPIESFVVMSSGQNHNEYNGECADQSSMSSEHDKDSRPVTVYSLMRNIALPNGSSVDDETRPKEFTFTKL